MQEKIIIAIGVLIAAFFSFFGWWMENGPDRKKESEEKQDRAEKDHEVKYRYYEQWIYGYYRFCSRKYCIVCCLLALEQDTVGNHRQDPGLSGYEQGQPLIMFP